MIAVGVGLSTSRDYNQAIEEATIQAKINLRKEKIDLMIVFSCVEFAYFNILKRIGNLLSPVSIPAIGCTATAIISNQGIFRYGLAVVLLSLPESIYFNNACVKEVGVKSTMAAGEELGEKLLYGYKDIRRDLSIVFSDGMIPDNWGIIHGLQKKLGRSFPLIGACASENLTFQKTYLYFNQEVANDATCGILLGGKLNFGLGIKHGWKPLGKPRYVTRASKYIIHEIDNTPAIRVYEEYFAKSLPELRENLMHITISYPIGINIAGEEEYLLRNIISIEDDGSLVLQGDISEGSTIRLMIGTKESCLAATGQAIDEAKKNFSSRNIDLVLVFSSAARYILLGRKVHRELEIIKEKLNKDTPIIGMYTYGEQAPLSAINYLGRTYFHNGTFVALALGG